LIDIHADRPLKNHPVYCMAKAGLAMMTKTLAKELGPQVRVNGVAPGAILWPQQGDGDFSETEKQDILDRVPLERSGSPSDIADTVLFIADGAPYITGQIIAVDGGRTLHG
jgi:pteridine reductase